MLQDAKLIDRLLSDEPAFSSSRDFGPHVAQGEGTGPSVLIGDMSQISLIRSEAVPFLDHRIAHLADPGDTVLVRSRDLAFEEYLKAFLGLTGLTFLAAETAPACAVATYARTEKAIRESLVALASAAGGITLKSYLTTATTWRLAQEIGTTANCTVHVSGPAPRISKRANDKLWFTRIARQVIGANAVPPTMTAYGPDAAAALALRFGKAGQKVIVKVPDSAGSAGNIRLDQSMLKDNDIDGLRTVLLDRLYATGWADSYPILVGVWDSHVTCSPSVQLWIPAASDGAPQAEGVFEQTVMGEGAAFVGAVRTTLPAGMKDRLVSEAIRIASVLQGLGYYGACSLDAVVFQGRSGDQEIHWIECNGRWSGVSIPLAALQKTSAGHEPGGIVIVQKKVAGRIISTSEAVQALKPLLFDATRQVPQKEGAVLLSPPHGMDELVASLLVFAPTQLRADAISQQAIGTLSNAAC